MVGLFIEVTALGTGFHSNIFSISQNNFIDWIFQFFQYSLKLKQTLQGNLLGKILFINLLIISRFGIPQDKKDLEVSLMHIIEMLMVSLIFFVLFIVLISALVCLSCFIMSCLIGIHPMQGGAAIARHRVTRKRRKQSIQ